MNNFNTANLNDEFNDKRIASATNQV